MGGRRKDIHVHVKKKEEGERGEGGREGEREGGREGEREGGREGGRERGRGRERERGRGSYLSNFIKCHYNNRSSKLPHNLCFLNKILFPFLQTDRINNTLPLGTLEAGQYN